MSLIMLYPWLKALHVAAALIFVAGILAASAFLRFNMPGTPHSAANAAAFQRWDRGVTVPAMLLVWVLGIELAITGQWKGAGWLVAKAALVIFISAAHGIQSGKLRRLSQGVEVKPAKTPWLILASIVGIAILVVVKPF